MANLDVTSGGDPNFDLGAYVTAYNQQVYGSPSSPVTGTAQDYVNSLQQPAAPATSPVDWHQYLTLYGVPDDVANEIAAIFARTADVNQATQLALAYVRGTDWYKATYPGIQDALAKGIVNDERGYRALLNDFNQVYRQWAGRDINLSEFSNYLSQGISADTLARQFAGDAYVGANRGDIEYLAGAFGDGRLNDQQLQAVGRQNAGLGSAQGTNLQTMLDKALQKMQRVFQGTLATPSLTLGGAGLTSPDLAGGKPQPDIGR